MDMMKKEYAKDKTSPLIKIKSVEKDLEWKKKNMQKSWDKNEANKEAIARLIWIKKKKMRTESWYSKKCQIRTS